MFKVFLSLSFLLIPILGFCQNHRIDSIMQLVDNQQGVERVKLLNQYAEEAIDADLDAAKHFAEEALEEAKVLKDWKGMAMAYDNMGLALKESYDTEGAMAVFFQSLDIRVKNKDEAGQMKSRFNIGELYYRTKDYNTAEENFLKSLTIAQKLEDHHAGALAYEGLGKVYLATKVYGKSLENFDEAFQLRLSLKDFKKASNIATKLGDISAKLGNHENAINYFQTSLNLYQELGDQKNISLLNTRISLSFLGQNMPEEALRFEEESYAIRRNIQDSVGMAESLKNIGLAYQKLNILELAKDNFTKSIDILQKTKVTSEVPEIFEAIARAYAELGEPELAFQSQLAFSNSRNVFFNQEKSNAILELSSRYESQFKNQEKQAQIELLEVENATSRKISYFLFAMLGLIGLLLTNLFLSFRRKQKDNHLLSLKNDEIIQNKNEIDMQNQELEAKNISLDLLNKKLVDEIAERENIEKSSFARDRFLATMSHEMRTPLNVITGLTHILLESNPRADQVEQLRTLQFSANDLVVFINDVLDYSKIEAGKLNLEDRPFQLAKVFDELKSKFEKQADEVGILFNFFGDPKLPENLLGDDARFMQIFSNLLSNTFQNTVEGYVNVDVSLHEFKSNKALLKIVVEGSDGGKRRNIFDDASMTWAENDDEFTGYEGQQFSLTITKRLVELQNGDMKVDIKEGDSTAFILLLPFKIAAGKSDVDNGALKKDFSDLAGQRIMIVEDNKINQLVVAKLLRKVGVDVHTANNGLEALELFDQMEFDLILMDIQMPLMDGYRATAEIRRHPNESKRDLPIIALTASAFLTEKEKAVLFGMNDHVGKPFSPDELLEKIHNCLKVYRSA